MPHPSRRVLGQAHPAAQRFTRAASRSPSPGHARAASSRRRSKLSRCAALPCRESLGSVLVGPSEHDHLVLRTLSCVDGHGEAVIERSVARKRRDGQAALQGPYPLPALILASISAAAGPLDALASRDDFTSDARSAAGRSRLANGTGKRLRAGAARSADARAEAADGISSGARPTTTSARSLT